jgi:hypothetical protein
MSLGLGLGIEFVFGYDTKTNGIINFLAYVHFYSRDSLPTLASQI